MSQAVVAKELEELILQAQQLCQRGERLAHASGCMVNPIRFRAALTMLIAAAGDLHSKGFVDGPVEVQR